MDDSKINKAKALIQQAMDILDGMSPDDSQTQNDTNAVADDSSGDSTPNPMMALKLAKYK